MSNPAGFAALLLLISPALGYCFAQAYFALRTIPGLDCCLAADYRDLVTGEAPHIEVKKPPDSAYTPNELSVRDAWHITAHYWNSIKYTSETRKGQDSLIERVTDHTHALGALLVGLMSAGVIWGLLCRLPQSAFSTAVSFCSGISYQTYVEWGQPRDLFFVEWGAWQPPLVLWGIITALAVVSFRRAVLANEALTKTAIRNSRTSIPPWAGMRTIVYTRSRFW